MSRCREVQIVLLTWDEGADLPEPIAIHVGACPACRARFDALFPPVRAPAAQLSHAKPLQKRSLSMPAAALAIAIASLAVSLWAGSARGGAKIDLAELIPPDCEAEVVLAECPVG